MSHLLAGVLGKLRSAFRISSFFCRFFCPFLSFSSLPSLFGPKNGVKMETLRFHLILTAVIDFDDENENS